MTCAKKYVECFIITNWPKPMFFHGTNEVENPQESCPRAEGEGYEKCKTICQQPAHAEEIALEQAIKAGADLTMNAFVCIRGIDHICKTCQRKLYAAGLRDFRFL